MANAQTMNQMQAAYRDALSALVDSWNRICPTGDTAALMRTDALTAKVNQNWPAASPRNSMAQRLIAKLTMAKLKIVLAKS